MKSKAEIIREHLKGLSVLDIGGSGFGETNPYESELKKAWAMAHSRTTVDISSTADICVDLNRMPLPTIKNQWNITIAFDVLEHLENPTEVLRWIPTDQLIVCLPNALSPLARRMEEKGRYGHRYSFTPYTAKVLMESSGQWTVDHLYFTFGKWSSLARAINAAGSLYPSHVGTGIVLHCRRTTRGSR
jgi:hypothetical protein